MATQRTRWFPDTCGCVVIFEWDDAAPEETRDHVATEITPCAEHPATGDLAADFETIKAHNRANQTPEG